MDYTRYDPDTGEILGSGYCQDEVISYYEPCLHDTKGDYLTQYVDTINMEIVNKTASPVTISGQNILNVPIHSKIITNGTTYDNCSGTVELEFTYSGVYDVVVKSPQNLDFKGTVTKP